MPLAPRTPSINTLGTAGANRLLRAVPDILTVGRSAAVDIVDCPADRPGTPTDLNACRPVALQASAWSVNGVLGGNLFHGRLSTAGPASTVRYTAPNVINWNETIAVTAVVPTTSGSATIVANIRLVPDLVQYTGTLTLHRTGKDVDHRWTAHVGFDENGDGTGRLRRVARWKVGTSSSCQVDDLGKVSSAALQFVEFPEPSGEEATYYRVGAVVELGSKADCVGPQGPWVDFAETVDVFEMWTWCKGLKDQGGQMWVRADGDHRHLLGEAECVNGTGEGAISQTLTWDLRRVDP